MKVIRRPLVSPVAVSLLCLVAFSGCANDRKVIWEQDKPSYTASLHDLQQQQQQLAEANRQQDEAMAEIREKLSEIELLTQLSQLQQAQIQALSAQMDALQKHRTAAVAARPEAPAAVAHVAAKKEATHRVSPVEAPTVPVVTETPAVDVAAQAEAEKNAYTAAYLALKSGRYDEASRGFNKQLDIYPNGEYADQAWYWLGETRLAQGENDNAVSAFKFVADHYPNSVKHGAALFKLAQIFATSNHADRAAEYYRKLINDHGDSAMAEQARSALKALEQQAPAPAATTESGQ
ncbi:tetratricopeptide repeat protein [Mariprofundus erugo]|uniref:Tetratricopeptide repeat protein n=1 Tax=Mariprofundus erugo TaxID=2528639 RepID=A0A5R9GLH9_9PROT|nr:tetratricopeptide repeat protein [Mariprofundus erugo]TLS65995.1 tetratricopeptide repeat protein [Mariprofundus erugo]TLS76348.1 tetratricopeptide repeat protein [Mariprofundus erugo]